jgi:hypothetical protein
MSRPSQRFFVDLRLRAGGALLLAISVSIFRLLTQGHLAGTSRDATLGELALIAIGFLCASIGAAMATVGAGLLDPCEVSERWTCRPGARPDGISGATPDRQAPLRHP